MFTINNLSKKDIEYINQCNNKELTNFISEEKSKSMTLHRKANIGYALLKCNLIDEACEYLHDLPDVKEVFNKPIFDWRTYQNCDGSYTTYDTTPSNDDGGSGGDDGGCCGCICTIAGVIGLCGGGIHFCCTPDGCDQLANCVTGCIGCDC